jgi:hypothetical protein
MEVENSLWDLYLPPAYGCPTSPDFLLGSVEPTNFMRLSLKKAAHANIGGAAYRKSGISLVFREMRETRTLTFLPLA